MKKLGEKMEERQLNEITKRLDRLIRIVALSSTKGYTSTERIYLLSQAGFGPKEIAEMIGTTQNVVNVRLSEMRKRRDRNTKEEGDPKQQ
jgi:DNA-directed RNA polymerase specialized sigma24 family protein